MLFVPTTDFSVKMPVAGRVDAKGNDDQTPQVQRLHVDAFRIDRTEVPMARYKADLCGQPNSDCLLNASLSGPAACVSQRQAECQCAKDVPGVVKRLPTDPEWILAALGTDGREFPWGKDAYPEGYRVGQNFCPEQANVPTRTAMCPVDANVLDVSPFGVIGMGTNGWEMTSTTVEHPRAGTGLLRVVRGATIDAGPLRHTFTWPVESREVAPNESFRCVTSDRVAR